MVSVCLAAKADETKLKPCVVFRATKGGSKSLDEEFESCCVCKSYGNAQIYEEPITIWVKQGLGKFSFNRRLLTWDSYECHMTDSVRKDLMEMNVDSVIIPGGCTQNILKHQMYVGISHLKQG